MRFFNTLGSKLEEFHPREKGKVRFYACGPTVHDRAHIGNFRTFLFEDILKRFLMYQGYEVEHVMNITDVDDKTILKAKKQNLGLREYTELYTQAFFEDCKTLKINCTESASAQQRKPQIASRNIWLHFRTKSQCIFTRSGSLDVVDLRQQLVGADKHKYGANEHDGSKNK